MSAASMTNFDVFRDYHNVINCKLKSAAKSRNGINPATGDMRPDVPVSSLEAVNGAVTAQVAFKTWSRVPFEERRKSILQFADALESHASDFAKLLTREQGKAVRTCSSSLVVD
jgi:acyl-CoA reductase-like NAD-dependent aldehyde dehydrogenase